MRSRSGRAERRHDDQRRWDALRLMTPARSLRIGEALMTSTLVRRVFPVSTRPPSLAHALGLAPQPPARRRSSR